MMEKAGTFYDPNVKGFVAFDLAKPPKGSKLTARAWREKCLKDMRSQSKQEKIKKAVEEGIALEKII